MKLIFTPFDGTEAEAARAGQVTAGFSLAGINEYGEEDRGQVFAFSVAGEYEIAGKIARQLIADYPKNFAAAAGGSAAVMASNNRAVPGPDKNRGKEPGNAK